METLIKADIFFFLTSIAVLVVIVVFVCAGFYLIQTLRNVRDISDKVKSVATLAEGDFDRIHEQFSRTWLGRLLFGKKRQTRNGKSSKQ